MLLRMRSLLPAAALAVAAASATTITSDSSVASGKSFDYVIAGAGLTGIVVANKLSNQGFSVLVVEAGKDLPNNPGIYDAERKGELANDPSTDCNWHYDAVAENGTTLPTQIDSGKCVGGSTSINGMVWYRPTVSEMDALAGFENPGWDSASLIPYMTATEQNIAPTDQQRADGADLDPSIHGFDGQVKVSFRTPMSVPGAQRLYKAAINTVFGIPASADLSKRDGRVSSSTSWSIFWDAASSINHRASAAYAYLYPSDQQRQGLTVLTEHIVSKVTFSGTKATGLQFGSPDSGDLFTVTANKEVLLASGTLGTPAILERSGVGAASLLSSLGITEVVDLPGVGMNLQDQPGTSLSALVTDAANSNTSLIDGHVLFAPVIALPNIDDVFGSDASSVASALQSGVADRAAAAVAAGVQANVEGATQIFQRATDLITKSKQPIAEVIGESYPSVMTTIFWPLTPLSRGHIHINSTAPFARPVITPRFLTDDYDVQTALHTAKMARSMYQTDSFKDIIQVVDVSGPKLNATDDEWVTFLKDSSFGASHWLGTSAMMPREWGGVVSPELKVYGTQNLRVIDASILPLQLTAHSSPMVYAVAHKAADLILG